MTRPPDVRTPNNQVASGLQTVIDPARVSAQLEVLERYAQDALRPGRALPKRTRWKGRPDAVVWPQTTEDVATVLRWANQERIPVTPYGGGTGLMGGAAPVEGGVVLDLKRMNRILEIRPLERLAVAESGTVLGDLEAALEQEGLHLGHDPWTRPIATIGGAISTNGLGYSAGCYGSMGDQVLGLEVVLPTGVVLNRPPTPTASVGIDLKHLFIGGEGCFGIITRATVRVFPRPESRVLHAIRFPSFPAGFQAIQQMFAAALRPSLLDYGEENSVWDQRAGVQSAESEPPAILYLGFEGRPEDVAIQNGHASELCAAAGGVLQADEEAWQFWNARHQAAERFQQARYSAPAPTRRVDYVHVVIPASAVLEYRMRAREIVDRLGLAIGDSGLWVQPELFSIVVSGNHLTEAQWAAAPKAVDSLLRLAQEVGGAMEYCHGVGVRLAHLMGDELGPGLQVLRGIKQALDPNDILNPGKLGL